MKLMHVAIMITDKAEIVNFYENIFQMKIVKEFVLPKELSQKIFNKNIDTEAILLQKDEMQLEVFIVENKGESAFNHLCISFPKRELIVSKAKEAGYKVIRIPRKNFDIIFIIDNDQNFYEIKES